MSTLTVTATITGDKGTGFQVSFDSNVDGPIPDGEVSLARRPDHCYFALNLLKDHNGHEPTFVSGKLTDEYIDRVFDDIDGLVTAFQQRDKTVSRTWKYS